uniref:Uncharacterized protein n=1 Tax=Acrobeloides nanus TaxID=290746 RepID=A0A914CMT3_9BILA
MDSDKLLGGAKTPVSPLVEGAATTGTELVPAGAVPGAVEGVFGSVPIRQGTTSTGQVTLNGVPIPDPPKNGLQLIVDDITFGIYEVEITIKKIELKVVNLRLTVSLEIKDLLEGLGSALSKTVGGLAGGK